MARTQAGAAAVPEKAAAAVPENVPQAGAVAVPKAGAVAVPKAVRAALPVPEVIAVPEPVEAEPVIELALAAADLPRLLRSAVLASHRGGRTRTSACRRIWHDTAAFTLRDQGLALSKQGGTWRLERLAPNGSSAWPPAGPAHILAEGASPVLLHRKLTQAVAAALVPVAAFTGTRRSVKLVGRDGPGRLDILDGALRGIADDEPACRVILAGEGPAMAALAMQLAGTVPLAIPRAGLAATAIARAADQAPPPRQLGAPEIAPGLTVSQALVLVISHLTDVILYWSAMIPQAGGRDAEPVHQMRVAVRRLRSALAIFRRAAAGPGATEEFRSLGRELKSLAGILGAARDWDVFLDGTGADVAAAFAGDRRVAAVLTAAGRKRQAAYAALHAHLGEAAWRHLTLRLALLPAARPWAPARPAGPERDEFGELVKQDDHSAMLAAPAVDYAAQALQRSFRRVAAAGEEFAALPPDAMHEARKQAKQLRYACEFFAPLFPAKAVRRFLERLEDVQETLGAVNDGHVAAALMGQISAGPDGRFATGVVQGYVAAASAPAARRAGKAWGKLLKQPVFWE